MVIVIVPRTHNGAPGVVRAARIDRDPIRAAISVPIDRRIRVPATRGTTRGFAIGGRVHGLVVGDSTRGFAIGGLVVGDGTRGAVTRSEIRSFTVGRRTHGLAIDRKVRGIAIRGRPRGVPIGGVTPVGVALHLRTISVRAGELGA